VRTIAQHLKNLLENPRNFSNKEMPRTKLGCSQNIFTWALNYAKERVLGTSYKLAIAVLGLVTFTGCFSGTSVKKISIVDPQTGVSIEVPVKSDGSFSHETKNEKSVTVASGDISDGADGFHNVKLVYELTVEVEPGKSRTEKIETTLQTKVDVEVPIGRNPSEPQDQQSDPNKLPADLTIKLSKG
jgi:hypothetical protein